MERRKKYFINKRIQGLYLVITASGVLLASVSVGIAVYCFFFSSFTEQIGAINLAISNFKIVTPADVVYLMIISITLLLLSVFMGLFFVVFTHRLVGPLERIQAAFDAVARGDYSLRIKVRENDHMRPIVDSFNQMLDSLQKKSSQ